MLKVNITSQPIRLAYNIENAKMNLDITPPKVRMETIPPKIELHQPLGELTIDQTASRYAIGLKNNAAFSRDNAERGKQAALETISTIVQEGHQLARIENNSNVIASIAANAVINKPHGVTLGYIPLPEIQYQTKPIQLNPIRGEINYNVQRGSVRDNYQPASVDIRVVQYPRVDISTVDVKI